jgi:hypothetical protein
MKLISLLLPIVGGVIELIGFVILAAELVRTNKSFLKYTERLAGDVPTFSSQIVSDGHNGRGEFSGGTIGETSPAAKDLASEIAAGKIATYVGLGFTAFGALLQIAGAALAYCVQ